MVKYVFCKIKFIRFNSYPSYTTLIDPEILPKHNQVGRMKLLLVLLYGIKTIENLLSECLQDKDSRLLRRVCVRFKILKGVYLEILIGFV